MNRDIDPIEEPAQQYLHFDRISDCMRSFSHEDQIRPLVNGTFVGQPAASSPSLRTMTHVTWYGSNCSRSFGLGVMSSLVR